MEFLGALAIAAFGVYLLSKLTSSNKSPGVRDGVAQGSRSINTKVVGVTFKNSDGISRQDIINDVCRAGQNLTLQVETNNPKDANAIAVYCSKGQIGYISSGRLKDDIAKRLNSGTSVPATITDVTGGTPDRPTRGVNISVRF